MTEEDEGTQNTTLQKFLVVGLITSEDFQKCRYALTKLHNCFPKEFESPDIRPMLDVEWNEFIAKHRRRLGNGLWSIKNCVAVFKDGEFLGDFDVLFEFIWEKRRFTFSQDWYDLACRHLIEYLEEKTDNYRQLVYLTIAINNQVIGSLLFQLYNDIVPLASENFLNRCRNEINGYLGTPVHRIVKNSWIQCGGYDLESLQIPCENYVVPHDRRGVLSMCNNGSHKNNSTQFYITLDNAPWMNYKYVAFGQLLQGDNVLKVIADVPTYYQAPTSDITIVKSGEFKTRFQAGSSSILFQSQEISHWKQIQEQMDILTYIRKCHQVAGPEDDVMDLSCFYEALRPRVSCDSILSPIKMQSGAYSLKSDLESYKPFSHLPDFGTDGDEADEDYGHFCEPVYSLFLYRKKLYDDNISPASSDKTL